MAGLITLFSLSICASLLWLGSAFTYIKDTIGFDNLMKVSPVEMSSIIAASISPVIFLWIIIAFIGHSLALKKQTKYMDALIKQSKRTNEHNEAVVRSMIEIQHQTKSSSMLDRVDLTIMDMNELLCEIILRCKIASNVSVENIWQRVGNGNKWAFCKVLLENFEQYPEFTNTILKKAINDNMLAGSLIEFGVRYDKLIMLLGKHDKERFITDVIENGILGRVFAILAPIIDNINQTYNTTSDDIEEDLSVLPEEPIATPVVETKEYFKMTEPQKPVECIEEDTKETDIDIETKNKEVEIEETKTETIETKDETIEENIPTIEDDNSIIEEEKPIIEEVSFDNSYLDETTENEDFNDSHIGPVIEKIEYETENNSQEDIIDEPKIKNPFTRYFKQTSNDLDVLEKNLFDIDNMIEDTDARVKETNTKAEELDRKEPTIEIKEEESKIDEDDFPFANWKNNYLKTGNDE